MDNSLPQPFVSHHINRTYLIFILITTIVIFFGLISYLLFANRQPPIKTKAEAAVIYDLIPPPTPILRNSDVTFTVTVDTQGQTIKEGSVWLSYQTDYMTFDDVTAGPDNNFPNITHSLDGDIIKIQATNSAGFNGTGVFSLVKFTMKDIEPPTGGVKLCVLEQPTPTPSPTFTPTPLPSSTPSPTPSATPTFTPTPTETPSPTPTLTPTPIPPTLTDTPVPPTPIPTIIPTEPSPALTIPRTGNEKPVNTTLVAGTIILLLGAVLKVIF